MVLLGDHGATYSHTTLQSRPGIFTLSVLFTDGPLHCPLSLPKLTGHCLRLLEDNIERKPNPHSHFLLDTICICLASYQFISSKGCGLLSSQWFLLRVLEGRLSFNLLKVGIIGLSGNTDAKLWKEITSLLKWHFPICAGRPFSLQSFLTVKLYPPNTLPVLVLILQSVSQHTVVSHSTTGENVILLFPLYIKHN